MIWIQLNVCVTSVLSFSFFVLGPPPFGSSWVKRYCTFVKEQKILHMVTFDHRSGGKIVSSHRTHSFYIQTVFTMQFFIFHRMSCHLCEIFCHPKTLFLFFSGWDRISHAQILSSQNDRHVGQEVLLRTRHNRPVHHLRNTVPQTRCDDIMFAAGAIIWHYIRSDKVT